MVKIQRTKRKGIKIQHNKTLLYVIIVLIILFIILVYYIAVNFKMPDNGNNKNGNNNVIECQSDSDCVPGSCCHATSCVNINNRPDCEEMMCTMECSGPLDCGAGHCGCINNKCVIIPD